MKTKFFSLWLLGLVSTLLGLPYILALQHKALEASHLPLSLVILISIAQSGILLFIAVFFGLRLSQKIQIQVTPLFDEKETPIWNKIKRVCATATPLGILIALTIRFGDVFFLQKLPQLAVASEQIPFWKALLVAFYGGVVEELLMRLFLVTLFAWLLGKLFKVRDVVTNTAIMWSSIILASVLFGLGHLPATATILPLTPLVIVRAILLNGVGGLVFGWLYWKKGLEYAIVAHFTTDVMLHAILISLLH